jgi:hypothetical protein
VDKRRHVEHESSFRYERVLVQIAEEM